MANIGFIGLGEMGLPMARNLIAKGHRLSAFDIRREAVETLVSLGAAGCASAKEVGKASDTILVMARTTDQVEAIVLGSGGLLDVCKSGSFIIVTSTINPLSIRKMAEVGKKKGVEVLDAPVSGGKQGAEGGSLSIMVGGNEDSFRSVLPILEVLGKRITYMGSHGMGEVAKISNNLLLLIHMNAAYEAKRLAEAAGLDGSRFLEAVKPSTGDSWVLEHWDMVTSWKENYKPDGTLDLIYKDFGLAYKLAEDLKIPIYIGAVASQLGRY